MKHLFLFSIPAVLCLLIHLPVDSQNKKQPFTSFFPGQVWKDVNNQPVNAHGGGILYHNGTYYWYGEYKKGITRRVDYVTTWEDYRVAAGGISCYSSKDLLHWKMEGIVLPPTKGVPGSDIDTGRVMERPKVIYNEKTKQFVLWLHIDKEDYSMANAGVAVSTDPTGPFHYLKSYHPNNNDARDMTLFKDEDGKAYLIFASEGNATMHICELDSTYTVPTSKVNRVFKNNSREAPALFKYKGNYYMISSACTGWLPNEALYGKASSIMGEWQLYKNPCRGKEAALTFGAQSTFIIPINPSKGEYLFMADRWNKTNLEDSRYVWLPLYMVNDEPVIEWKEQWSPAIFKKKEGN